jgi:Methyltransferase domain
MNDLELFFKQNKGRLIDKWIHYFDIYDRHFARFRGTQVNVVEFGVSQGGSLQMWKQYFGDQVQLFGVDINPECKQFEEPGVQIFIGDQEDREFLRTLARTLPRIDILIDDGGHTMGQQINTFEELFPRIDPNGVYLIEDLHTSYWRDWGGGYGQRGTFIEYSKHFIDRLNAWHSHESRRLKVSDFTKCAHSMHYYDSVLVIEKRPMTPPQRERTGEPLFADYEPKYPGLLDRIKRRLGQ